MKSNYELLGHGKAIFWKISNLCINHQVLSLLLHSLPACLLVQIFSIISKYRISNYKVKPQIETEKVRKYTAII